MAAEISIALLPEAEDGTPVEVDPSLAEDAEPRISTRRVLLPLRPRDIEKELNPDADANGDDEDDDGATTRTRTAKATDDVAGEDGAACVTVAQCIALNQALFDGLPPETQQSIQSDVGALCFKDVGHRAPGGGLRMRRRGFVLVVVVFFTVLLFSGIATFLRRSTLDAAIVRNRDFTARAEALARGGVRLGIVLLQQDRLEEEADRSPKAETTSDLWAARRRARGRRPTTAARCGSTSRTAARGST